MARAYPPTGSQPPSVELTVRQGPQPGQRFSLTRPTIIIGRTAGNDVVVNHPEVSRRHASLTWDGRQFVIQDLGSANGTFVNGVRLTAPQVLQPGDVIGLGPTVLFGFRATLPVVSPSTPLRTGPAAPPAYVPRPPARRRRRFLIPLAALLGLCVLLATAAAAGYYFLWPRPEARPLVLINSPRAGARVAVGEETTIHAIARDNTKVKRVELWVDGKLLDAQSSNVPGGIPSFLFVTVWRPPISGIHVLTVRAFNAQGGRNHASIDVNAAQSADRDDDAVADATDACPDQAGPASARGCPTPRTGDRDGDGVRDQIDACPNEPGSIVAEGCPDADHDTVRDSADACPRESGSPDHNGCPAPGDADGDEIADANDACPQERGPSQLAGCPDSDGDGVRNRDDQCPNAWGLPGTAGCPDRDGDGVRDSQDLCPDTAGAATNFGCPVTNAGDRDGDRVPDDIDLTPDEQGLAEHGGSPPPGQGADRNGNRIPDDQESPEDQPRLFGVIPLPGFLGTLPARPLPIPPQKLIVSVEIQALEFSVSPAERIFSPPAFSPPYDEIFCYVYLTGQEPLYIGPFDWTSGGYYDIAEWVGGEASRRTIMVDDQGNLDVTVECSAYEYSYIPEGNAAEYYDLGSFTQQHPSSEWNTGSDVTVTSSGGSDGRTFTVRYRLCSPLCQTAAFPAPMITQRTQLGLGLDEYLYWEWHGNPNDLRGLRVYVNGNRLSQWINPSDPRGGIFRVPLSAKPHCDETSTLHITAFNYEGGIEKESAPSNVETFRGGPCQQAVRVTFRWLHVGDLKAWYGERIMGPVYGTFWVTGSTSDRMDFEPEEKIRRSDPDDSWDRRTYDLADLTQGNNSTIVAVETGGTLQWAMEFWDREPGNTPNRLLFTFCNSERVENLPSPDDPPPLNSRIYGQGPGQFTGEHSCDTNMGPFQVDVVVEMLQED